MGSQRVKHDWLFGIKLFIKHSLTNNHVQKYTKNVSVHRLTKSRTQLKWLITHTQETNNRFWYWEVRCCFNKYLKMWKWLWNQAMGESWNNFELHDRKVLLIDYLEKTAGRNDIKSNFDIGSEGRDRDSKEHFKHLREFLYCEQTVGRNYEHERCFW